MYTLTSERGCSACLMRFCRDAFKATLWLAVLCMQACNTNTQGAFTTAWLTIISQVAILVEACTPLPNSRCPGCNLKPSLSWGLYQRMYDT